MKAMVEVGKVPDGFEVVRYGRPKASEYYLHEDKAILANYDLSLEWLVLRKIGPPTESLPSGYEFTGEFRKPGKGDVFLADNGRHGAVAHKGPIIAEHIDGGKRWILRKAFKFPTWMTNHYKGCWLFKGWITKDWFVSANQPSSRQEGYGGHGPLVCVDSLASLHGDKSTFEPPTHTDCLQIV